MRREGLLAMLTIVVHADGVDTDARTGGHYNSLRLASVVRRRESAVFCGFLRNADNLEGVLRQRHKIRAASALLTGGNIRRVSFRTLQTSVSKRRCITWHRPPTSPHS